MTIKQSAAFLVLMAAITLTGAGCIPQTQTQPPLTPPSKGGEISKQDETADWVHYDSTLTGNIGMTFLYPPKLTPVTWDTQAWGSDAVGVDFTGFGIARIPNVQRLSPEEWVSSHYAGFTFSMPPVDRDNVFYPAIPTSACNAVVVNDDFRNDAGLSGIGGTVIVNVGDASLYAFTLGQDWDQTIGDREKTIRTIMQSVEWFAEQTVCPETVSVRDDRVGIAFSVPRNLAPVVTQDEFGWGVEEEESTVTDFTCLEQRAFQSVGDDQPTIFLAVNDTWECQTLGRGGYWGDQARTFVTDVAVEDWCKKKDSCESFVNANGITIWHAYSKSVDDWGDTLADVDEYAAFNPNKSIHGILFSNQGFQKNDLGRQEEALRAIVESLKFIE